MVRLTKKITLISVHLNNMNFSGNIFWLMNCIKYLLKMIFMIILWKFKMNDYGFKVEGVPLGRLDLRGLFNIGLSCQRRVIIIWVNIIIMLIGIWKAKSHNNKVLRRGEYHRFFRNIFLKLKRWKCLLKILVRILT